jgi:hypothetical protein
MTLVVNALLAGILRLATPPAACDGDSQRLDLVESFRELDASFPRSVSVHRHGDERVLEFCPDNTCSAFVAHRRVPDPCLADFAYLFVYYFSDYQLLTTWRALERPAAIAGRILAKARYRSCRRDSAREAALCVLRLLEQRHAIGLFFVRYDEGVRSSSRAELP